MIENFNFKKRQEVNSYEQRLKDFYENDSLDLDTHSIVNSVEQIRNGNNLTVLNDFIINNDLLLSNNESGKVAMACKKTGDGVFVSKENKLDELNTDNILEIESFLKSKNFQSKNVLLPTETIKLEGDKKIFRFYEAGDTDLEKYANSKEVLPVKKCISLLIRICDGVESLHEVGVGNIDLAPLNIIITKNDAKITDIDSASIDREENGELKTNNFTKNRFLSAPELFKQGNTVDKTVDIYSASCILYRLVYGDWPYNIEKYCRENKIDGEYKQKIYEFLHNSGDLNFPEVTDLDIKRIIKKGMKKNPKERYSTMREMISDLIDVYNK